MDIQHSWGSTAASRGVSTRVFRGPIERERINSEYLAYPVFQPHLGGGTVSTRGICSVSQRQHFGSELTVSFWSTSFFYKLYLNGYLSVHIQQEREDVTIEAMTAEGSHACLPWVVQTHTTGSPSMSCTPRQIDADKTVPERRATLENTKWA